jgi:hypothetical protein
MVNPARKRAKAIARDEGLAANGYFLPGTEKFRRYFIAIAASRAIGTPVV